MLKAGVHFGHKTSRWHPSMSGYIYTAKSGVHVINLELTAEKLAEAVAFLKKASSEGKVIAFVGTKKQASAIVEKAAKENGISYVNHRWLGGMLTNFDVIKSAIERFKTEKVILEGGKAEDLSKRDLTKLRERIEKGEKIFGGLVDLTKKPDVLILIGAHDEKNALAEARLAGVKTVALTDTNTNPALVDYPVPANDDATKSIELFANLFAKTIKESRTLAVKKEESK